MISSLRFGAVHQVWTPQDQTTKPQLVRDIESKAQVSVTGGPVDVMDWAPPPSEGGTPVHEWQVFTDEDALVVARDAGIDVSMTKSATENQAAIDTYMQNGPFYPNGGIGYIMTQFLARAPKVDFHKTY